MRAWLAAVCIAACAGLQGSVTAQALTYREIVERYRLDPNDGVERMLALPEAVRRGGVDSAIGATGPDAWSWDELAAAAMMHTDAGFYFLTHQQPAIPYLTDAERLLAQAHQRFPGRSIFVRRWYQVIDAILKGTGDNASARAFASHFGDRFKDSPSRVKAIEAYHRGVFDEFDGCQKGEFLTITGLTESGGNLVQRYFVPAAREFDTVLSLDPSLLEAALHLGRVRMLEGRHNDARELLRRAARSPSRSVAYLAQLFVGSFAERASAWEDAEQAYRAAMAQFPSGQSANLALAQLLDRRGRGTDATRLITAWFARPGRSVDPWWLYFEEASADSGARIAMLRAEVLR